MMAPPRKPKPRIITLAAMETPAMVGRRIPKSTPRVKNSKYPNASGITAASAVTLRRIPIETATTTNRAA